MHDGEGNEVEFDIENIMAEIQVAAPELVGFLAWVSGSEETGECTEDELHSALELVYSYAKSKNEDEEERMMDGRV